MSFTSPVSMSVSNGFSEILRMAMFLEEKVGAAAFARTTPQLSAALWPEHLRGVFNPEVGTFLVPVLAEGVFSGQFLELARN